MIYIKITDIWTNTSNKLKKNKLNMKNYKYNLISKKEMEGT